MRYLQSVNLGYLSHGVTAGRDARPGATVLGNSVVPERAEEAGQRGTEPAVGGVLVSCDVKVPVSAIHVPASAPQRSLPRASLEIAGRPASHRESMPREHVREHVWLSAFVAVVMLNHFIITANMPPIQEHASTARTCERRGEPGTAVRGCCTGSRRSVGRDCLPCGRRVGSAEGDAGRARATGAMRRFGGHLSGQQG